MTTAIAQFMRELERVWDERRTRATQIAALASRGPQLKARTGRIRCAARPQTRGR